MKLLQRYGFTLAVSALALLLVAYILVYASFPDERRLFDLRERHEQLRCLDVGLYPNIRLHAPGVIPRAAHSVYPPTSLVQLWLVSPFASFKANAAFFFLLTGVAFAILSVHAWRVGRVAGRWGGLLAVAGLWCMSASFMSVKAGQPALLINAILVLMSGAVMKNRQEWAGCAWIAAMMKPHTSLPFFALFVAKRRWYACFVGAVLMGALGWGVCSFTGHTMLEVLHASYGQSPMKYASTGDTLVQPLMSLLGIGHRPAVLITALLAMGLLLPFVFRPLATLPSLVHLSAAGVAGRLGFYHRHYDDVMLAFLLLALIEEALRSRSVTAWTVMMITGLTLWVPYPLLAQFPRTSWRIVIWASALVYLTLASLKRVSVSTNTAPGEQVSVG